MFSKDGNGRVVGTLTLEDVPGRDIFFRNFSGIGDKYNAEGNRNFNLTIPENIVPQMIEDGWNVKESTDRDTGENIGHSINVKVSYNNSRPTVYTISSGNQVKTPLDESTIGMLDDADIVKADITITPYNWENASGATGVKGYVKTLIATINVDPLLEKYDLG